jgi:uroporphyrinogen-III synthase
VSFAQRRLISEEDLRGQPGLSRVASLALVAAQPHTVLEALRIIGVGRKTTKRLLALGLVTDPEGAQRRSMARIEAAQHRQSGGG